MKCKCQLCDWEINIDSLDKIIAEEISNHANTHPEFKMACMLIDTTDAPTDNNHHQVRSDSPKSATQTSVDLSVMSNKSPGSRGCR